MGIPRNSVEGISAAASCVAITPHATNAIPETRGLMVNVAGNVACRFADDATDVTLTLSAGVLYAFRITHVRVTGTTATGIHGFY